MGIETNTRPEEREPEVLTYDADNDADNDADRIDDDADNDAAASDDDDGSYHII